MLPGSDQVNTLESCSNDCKGVMKNISCVVGNREFLLAEHCRYGTRDLARSEKRYR